MTFEKGELILYQSDDGQAAVDVRLKHETVWLTQAQMVKLFQRNQSVISRHVNNVFKEGELPRKSNMQKMHIAISDKPVAYYNLDVIISVGYRVKSRRGTQFRIWATSVLKDHLIKGYTLNQKRLAEKGTGEARQMLALLSNTLINHELVNDEGQAVLHIVQKYADTWRLLWQYDEDSLALPVKMRKGGLPIQIDAARQAIANLRQNLMAKGEATDIFGNERLDSLAGIIGAMQQTFDGQDLYSSVEEKAAHLLYFVIKDHPFTDGNKRIGSFLFLVFLEMNGLLAAKRIDNKTLVALALLIAASDPRHKELMVKLITNLLVEKEEPPAG